MFNSQFQIPIRKRLSGATVRVRFRECKRRHSTIHLRSPTGGLPGLRSRLGSPGFFSTILNSADRFFVILVKPTLKAGVESHRRTSSLGLAGLQIYESCSCLPKLSLNRLVFSPS